MWKEFFATFFSDQNHLQIMPFYAHNAFLAIFFIKKYPCSKLSNQTCIGRLKKGSVSCNLGVKSLLHPFPGLNTLFWLKQAQNFWSLMWSRFDDLTNSPSSCMSIGWNSYNINLHKKCSKGTYWVYILLAILSLKQSWALVIKNWPINRQRRSLICFLRWSINNVGSRLHFWSS